MKGIKVIPAIDSSGTLSKPCSKCKQNLPVVEFYKCKGSFSGLSGWCKKCIREHKSDDYRNDKKRFIQHSKNSHRKLKIEMVSAYGGKCTCCGESDLSFLTLEHTLGDGKEHRTIFKSAASVWRDLKRRGWPKVGYTVFCMNCNWGTRGGGECPHVSTPIAYGWCF